MLDVPTHTEASSSHSRGLLLSEYRNSVRSFSMEEQGEQKEDGRRE